MSDEPVVDLRIGCMDRAMAGFAERTPVSFHLVVDLDGVIDADALEAAWQALGRRHPILRAHASFPADPDRWDVAAELPSVVCRTEPAHRGCHPGWVELATVQDSRPDAGVALNRLVLIERDEGTRLVWSCNHVLLDGASGLEVVATLAGYYRSVCRGRPPDPEVDARPRIVEDLVAGCGLNAVNRSLALSRYSQRWVAPARSDHPQPASTSPGAGYSAVDVSAAVRATAERRRLEGWRLSATLVALLSRAWNRVFDDGSPRRGTSGWQVASDLRTELRSSGGLGNFSATEPLTLTAVGDRPLEVVIAEANRELSGLGSTWPGLGAALAAMGAARLPWAAFARLVGVTLDRVSALGYTRSFSNLGVWSAGAEDWGGAQVSRAFYVPSFTDPEWVIVAAQTVAGRTWLSMRTHELGIGVDDVARLGEVMTAEAARLR